MMDDEWYATNLATGEQLHTLGDILEGQVWHYLNWGGRSITHGILQGTLMLGEFWADILNLGMTFLLAYMICVVAGQRDVWYFLLSLSLLISFNANAKMSMFWQAGLVNYVYSSVWILLFLWPYMRAVDAPESVPLPGVVWWMLPLGVMTGWSNENMGPTCFVIASLVILYQKWVIKKKIPVWMWIGAAASLIGSVLVVAAPGNFVRSSTIENRGLWNALTERFFSMFQAGMDFLFPIGILIAVLLVIYIRCFRGKLEPGQMLLIVGMVLSYGAMVLSPHYPDRATFGTMVLGIVLTDTLLAGILGANKGMKRYADLLQLCTWACSLLILLDMMRNTGVVAG